MTAPSVIAERYEVRSQLGRGGTAAVYRVFDRSFKVERALKLLTVAPRYRAGLRRRLEREAQAMAALDNPHLIRVYDIGVDGEYDYVVMDLAEGGSLSDVLDEHGPLPEGTALAYTLHLLAALDAAHAARVIHRDVKPQNILLTHDGTARLADFGIALLDREDIERHTRVGAMMGSLAYMAPEQRQDARSVGPEADLYAAGCTLYNLLTGSSPLDLFLAAPSSPRWMDVPPAVQALLMRATRPEPEDRYRTAREMARDVAGLLQSTTTAATGPVYPPEATTTAALKALLGDEPLPRPAPSILPGPGPAPALASHPPTVVPGAEDASPTISPPTQVPKPADSSAPRWVLALLGLGALGLGGARLMFPPLPTERAAHIPLSIAQPPLPKHPSPRQMLIPAERAIHSHRAQEAATAPPAQAGRTPPAKNYDCDGHPVGTGNSPVSGIWEGTRQIGGSASPIILTLGGAAGSVSGCSRMEFAGGATVDGVQGSLSGDTLNLQDSLGTQYTLTVTSKNLSGTIKASGNTSQISLNRVR